MGLWHVQSLLMCLIFWHHFMVTFKFEWEMTSSFPVPFLASVGLLLQYILVCCGQYQLSSVAQSCPTLCDPMNHSTPVLEYLNRSHLWTYFLVEIVISRQRKGCWSYLFFTVRRRNTFLANRQVKEQAVSTAFSEGVSHCRYGRIPLARVRFPGPYLTLVLAQVVEFTISGVSSKPFIHGIWPWERNLHVKIKLSLFFIGLGDISHNEIISLNIERPQFRRKGKKVRTKRERERWEMSSVESMRHWGIQIFFVQC